MDILAIILACSLHLDDELVRVLVDVQSGANLYFVGDLDTLKSRDSLGSIEEALRVADDIRKHGGRPAVGLLGIPLDWGSRYGRAPGELFDACTNIAVGTAALAEYNDLCTGKSPRFRLRRSSPRRRGPRRDPDSTPLRTCILSRLAVDLGVRGAPAIILKAIAVNRSPAGSDSPDPPPQRSGIFTETSLGAAATTEWTDFSVHVPVPTKIGVAAARPFTSVAAPAASPFPVRRAPNGLSDLRVAPSKLPPSAAAAAMPSPSASARQ